jgi:hypothetical protein
MSTIILILHFFFKVLVVGRFAGRVGEMESIAVIALHLMTYKTSSGKPSGLQEIGCSEYHQHHHLNSSVFLKSFDGGKVCRESSRCGIDSPNHAASNDVSHIPRQTF